MMCDVLNRIKRKLMKIRLKPIRVYCLHHVSASYDAESMNRGDWMDIAAFKQNVQAMQQSGVEFISLSEAYKHICKDWVRCKKYAVLTFDDGYASLKEILPWLNEQLIPCTLFINGKYLDGQSFRKNPKERYLTKEELMALDSPLIEIGSHGWEHNRVLEMTQAEFENSAEINVKLLGNHKSYIPFWAYTYGEHTQASDEYLRAHSIEPVYVDGEKNYNDSTVVHRELIV